MVHKVVDKDDLASQLTAAGDKLVVIDFYATWCGPCRMIAPVLEKLSTDHKDTLVVLKIDVDENEEITSEYGVSSMPTFVFLKLEKRSPPFLVLMKQNSERPFKQTCKSLKEF
ncbi:Thioredoxin-2 [Sarcoptes scabiei]|uniref:Thioredoxin-2 n=1 Tax=Sarcoptes scabiei TaxID=52283 RepID=A0A834R601_SARSC|nr:Thioredoxin-2 [Sarcoptes scabiei]